MPGSIASDDSYAPSNCDARTYEIETNLTLMLRDPSPLRSALFRTNMDGDTICMAEQQERTVYMSTYMLEAAALRARGLDLPAWCHDQLTATWYYRPIPFAHLQEDRVVFRSWHKIRSTVMREWQVDGSLYDIWIESTDVEGPEDKRRSYLISSHETWSQRVRDMLLAKDPSSFEFGVILVPAKPTKKTVQKS